MHKYHFIFNFKYINDTISYENHEKFEFFKI